MFIRTKDKIYEIESDFVTNKGAVGFNVVGQDEVIVYKDIIQKADNIEDLCDGFIGITTKEYPNRPDIEPFIHYFQKPFEFEYGNNAIKHLKLIDVELKNQNGWSYSTKHWFESCDIYGFVRTTKGLIYVAKMNDEGELELI